MNEYKDYQVYVGHWNYERDCMDDEELHFIPDTLFKSVWTFCERLTNEGFDVICEVKKDDEWIHLFCL